MANMEGKMTATALKQSRKDKQLAAHNETGRSAFEAIKELVDALRASGEPHSDEAEQAIHEDALSVLVRGGWHELGKPDEDGPEEYEILLSTGGPATRIRGELSEHGEPTSARLEVQDWFVPWKEWRDEGWSEDVLLDYARCFYFGD